MREIGNHLQPGSGSGRVHYREAGRGPAVLLLHGWALDLDQWTDVADALADSFRVVRIDRPGFGESTGTPSTDADVRAIAGTIDALGLGPAAIVACSQAGRGTLRYALQSPGSVSALVLDGVPLEGFAPAPEGEDAAPVAELAALLEREGLGAVREALAAHAFFRLHGAEARATDRLQAMLGRYRAADLRAPAGDALAPARAPANVAARLGELRMPALVLNGEFDTPHRRLTGEALAYGLPRAERAVLRGAGHLAALERPGEYADLLRGFLQRHLNPLWR